MPWASKQLWAPDAAYKNNTYYLVFPARDKDDIFRLGVATSLCPAATEPAIGPRVAELNDYMLTFKESPKEVSIIKKKIPPYLRNFGVNFCN